MSIKFKYAPYSSSKLTVASCPARFKEQYIDKTLTDTSSMRSKKGNVIHECFEVIIDRIASGEHYTLEEAKQLVTEKLIKYGITDAGLVEECQRSVGLYLMHKYQFPYGVCASTVVGTEEELAIKKDENDKWVQCDWEDPEAILRGKIDVLCVDDENFATIIDHKTQRNKEKSAATPQMGIYAFLVKQCYPHISGVQAIIHYADHELSKKTNCFSDPAIFTSEDLQEVEERVMNQIMAIESLTNYEVNTAGVQCAFCPIANRCSFVQEELEKSRENPNYISKAPITSAEEAVRLAEKHTVLAKVASDANSKLKKFCEDCNDGNVIINGRIYGFMPSYKYEPINNDSKSAILEALKKAGHDPMDYCKIDMIAVQKTLLFEKREPTEEIGKHVKLVTKTSFRNKKI